MAKRFLTTLNLSPSTSDPATGSEGDAYFNSSSNKIRVYYDGAWNDLAGGGGGSSNSFETISTPSGTSPVADSSTDTLSITAGTGMIITGSSSTDTIDFATNATASNTASTIVARDSDQAFDITAIDFDTTDTIASAVGRLTWDDGEGTLNFGLKGGNINLQIGQENIALCYNGTGSTITKGSVVYISGAQGQRPSITLSDADTEATSSKTFGVAAENISSGAEGFVCTFGIVTGVDTSSFTAGQALWLSSTAGQLTNVKPTQPIHSVFIGYCLSVNAVSGRIFVNPQNGYELQELHNVLINGISDNHILSYDNATSLWKNQGLAAAIQEIDGASSGIDADLLDGQHGSYYAPINNPTFTGTVTLNADPTQDLQAATKQYVDAVAQGLHIHASCAAATTTDISNLSSPPASIDGVNLTTNMRVLVKNQSTTSQNGIYVFNGTALVRATDFDSAAEIDGGDFVFVTGGTINNDTGWVQTETVGTVGSDPIIFTQFSGAGTYTAGNGLTLTGSQFSINTGITADLSTAQTLTNKTINGANNSLTVRLANDITGFGTGVATFLATPTSANLAAAVTDETGTGSLVFATSPTLVTPNIGAATGTSLSTSGAITASATSGRVSLGLDAGGSISLGRIDNTSNTPYIDFNSGATTVDFDVRVQASGGDGTAGNGTLTITGALATEASSTGHAGFRLPHGTAPTSPTNGDIWTTTSGLFARINGATQQYAPTSGTLAQFAATTSAQLAGVISDETGSGPLVFATSPTLVTPTLGVATATSINKVTVTAPTTSATLTLADGSTLATSGAFSVTLTATGATNVTLPTSGTLATTTQALQWDGGSTNLVASTGRTSLGATTVGSNIFTLTNPSAITFLKINADNTITAESASTFKTSLSLNNVENTAISTWTGSNNINTIGATTIDSNALVDATSTSITANTATTIDTIVSATHRSAEYIVQVTQGTKYTVSKLIMIHDGTTAHITEYSLIELGASRIPLTISGTLSGGNILLQATITDAATTNATAKVFKTAIVV